MPKSSSQLPSIKDIRRNEEADLPIESKVNPEGKQSDQAKPVSCEGYLARAVDVKMKREQAIKFKRIQRSLEDSEATLDDGTPVNNKRRAVLWLIENFGR